MRDKGGNRLAAALVAAGYLVPWTALSALLWLNAARSDAPEDFASCRLSLVFMTVVAVLFLVLHLPPLWVLFRVRADRIRRGSIARLAHPAYFATGAVLLGYCVIPVLCALFPWVFVNACQGAGYALEGHPLTLDGSPQEGNPYDTSRWHISLAGHIAFMIWSTLPSVLAAVALPLWLGDPREGV